MLWHYTARETLDAIAAHGYLEPAPSSLLLGRPAVWFTDTRQEPGTQKARRALGLDHDWHYTEDRTTACIEVVQKVNDDPIFLWSNVAFEYPGAWAFTDAALGARPDTWWLAFTPIKLWNFQPEKDIK